jgi:hypothetical protein
MVYLSNVNYIYQYYVLQLFMLFSTSVLEFWNMEKTNIYDFLHLLSLIKIKPNMDFGRNLTFAHKCHDTSFSFSFSL